MNDKVKDFLKQKKIAVVGSFRSKEKVAYRVLLKLAAAGYEVYPVNPSTETVEGCRCYPSVGEIPCAVDAADIVTPPAVTEKVVAECVKKKIGHVWMQPGAESKKAVEICEKNGINVIHDACLLVEMAQAE